MKYCFICSSVMPYETDLRMLVVESYIALYRIETETVSVGRIINARQDYIRILFGEVTPQ